MISGSPSWHVTAISVLAGIGAGYLIGLLTIKWLNRGHAVSSSNVLLTSRAQRDLMEAITNLTSEMEILRTVISNYAQRTSGYSTFQHGTESATDFMSAQGDVSESDDDFFDFDERGTGEASNDGGLKHDMEYLDEVGKTTLESEEACLTLIEEIKNLLESSPDDPGLLWRLSRALVHLSMHYEQKGEDEDEKQLLIKAAEYAERALELDKSIYQSHQWYAIAIGSQVKHECTQRKITMGNEYKDHIDAAISLESNDPNLYYLRGMWSFNVAGLSWLEKKAAAALYATLPECTYSDSMEDFMRVEELKPGVWKANLLMVAKCHIKLGDVPTSLDWLQKALKINVVTTEDKRSHAEVEELLRTCATELESC